MTQLFDPVLPAYAQALEEGLAAHNRQTHISREEFLIAECRDGTLIGGVRASVSLEALFIKHLWVADQCRRMGLGRRLMAEAEAEGLRRGVRVACVDTLSTQAPDFYRHLGYEEFGRLEGLGPEGTISRIWFRKMLWRRTSNEEPAGACR